MCTENSMYVFIWRTVILSCLDVVRAGTPNALEFGNVESIHTQIGTKKRHDTAVSRQVYVYVVKKCSHLFHDALQTNWKRRSSVINKIIIKRNVAHTVVY